MYHFIEDKEFSKKLKGMCSCVINRLVQHINNGNVLRVEAYLVGSGAKNLITQNSNEPIDLDYNLCVLRSLKFNINDCENIKEYVRKEFNKVLNSIGWEDCSDSKSALQTGYIHFSKWPQLIFSIDLAIVYESGNSWYRLIHKKTGNTKTDEWIWNQGPNSNDLYRKVAWIKNNNYWNELREVYLNKKNMYLRRNDYNHPSFVCYIESINEVYNKY